MDSRVEKCLSAKRESKAVEFKESFNPGDLGEWCEILKDIVAITNTGGGAIAVGLDSRGKPTGTDLSAILNLDPAVVTDKVAAFTGHQFTDFEIVEAEKSGQKIAVLTLGSVSMPLVFEKAGNYHTAVGKQKTAFNKGTVYFRHGAKSEPGDTEDLHGVIERKLESIRTDWLDGVRKVVDAPSGSQVVVLTSEVCEDATGGATPIRIVDDPKAPAYRRIDYDITHPYRQKDLVAEVNRKLPEGVRITAYDILAIRRTSDVDGKDEFCHHPKFGSPQYGDALVDWIVRNNRIDQEFFVKARRKYYEQTH